MRIKLVKLIAREAAKSRRAAQLSLRALVINFDKNKPLTSFIIFIIHELSIYFYANRFTIVLTAAYASAAEGHLFS